MATQAKASTGKAARRNEGKKARTKHLVRALRVELARPLSEDWDTAGATLRQARAVAHHALNAAVVAAEITKSDPSNETHPQTAAYRAVNEAIEGIEAWARKSGKQPGLEVVDVGSAVRVAWSGAAYDQWQRWRKDRFGPDGARIPSFKRGAPIMVPAANWSAEEDGGRVRFTIKLRRKGSVTFAVRPSRGAHWDTLRAIAAGDVRCGAAKVVLDAERNPPKWYALLPYYAEQTTLQGGDGVMVVHRGVHNFLTAMSSGGQYRVLARGDGLLAQRRAIQARRRRVKRAIADVSRGARGHGRSRRYRDYDGLGDKLNRITDLAIRSVWSEAVRLARQWGCGMIVIEDYGGIAPDVERAKRRFVDKFPLFALKQWGQYVCKREGLTLDEVRSNYISSTCPVCGHEDTGQHNDRTGVFHCTSPCGFSRPADWVASLQMLRAAGFAGIWDERLAREQRMFAALRGAGIDETANESVAKGYAAE